MGHDQKESGSSEAAMLLKIKKYSDLNERKLMDVYAESNLENTDYFFPDEPDKETAVQKVETGFLNFLKSELEDTEKPARPENIRSLRKTRFYELGLRCACKLVSRARVLVDLP